MVLISTRVLGHGTHEGFLPEITWGLTVLLTTAVLTMKATATQNNFLE